MEQPTYQITSNLDGWEIDVYGPVPRTVAQWIADTLGIGIDYIQPEDVADIARRMVRAWIAHPDGEFGGGFQPYPETDLSRGA